MKNEKKSRKKSKKKKSGKKSERDNGQGKRKETTTLSDEHEDASYTTYSGADLGPTLVQVPFARSLYEYFYRALDLGALEGPLGQFDVAADLLPLIDAVHHVLAGGEVKIEVTRKGNPDLVKELSQLRKRGRDDSNAINRESGYYATPAV